MYNAERSFKNNLKKSQERNLMVINDHQIRLDLFSPTAALIKKIKKLTVSQKDFLNIDKFLYENWYQLTFREETREIQSLEKHQNSLFELQIHLLSIAENSRVSLQAAHLLLKEEEIQFRAGDEDWKFIITKLRGHRLEYAKNKVNEKMEMQRKDKMKYQEEYFASFFDTQPLDESILPTSVAGDCPNISRLNRKSRAVYYYSKEVSAEVLEKLLREKRRGQSLFKELFKITMEVGDWSLLGKLWMVASEGYKNKILKKMPSHLMSFLNQLILDSNSPSKESQIEGYLLAELNLKAIYHKLARYFHPDVQTEDCDYEALTFAEQMLKEAQEAYFAKDLARLKRLEMMALIHQGDLRSLTLDEIYQSSIVLAQELENLKRSIKLNERHPAWRFSSRRSHSPLISKIRADFYKRKMLLLADVQDLEYWFSKTGLKVENMVTPPRLERGSIV